MQDRFQRFSLGLFELSRYWHRIAGEEMRRYGLKGPYSVYFTALRRYPEGLTPVELGKLAGRDKADVSRAMTALSEKGLIEKDTAQRKYRALLRLTEEGRQIADQICQKADAVVEYAGRDFSAQKRAEFYEMLEQIAENLQKICREDLSPASNLEGASK